MKKIVLFILTFLIANTLYSGYSNKRKARNLDKKSFKITNEIIDLRTNKVISKPAVITNENQPATITIFNDKLTMSMKYNIKTERKDTYLFNSKVTFLENVSDIDKNISNDSTYRVKIKKNSEIVENYLKSENNKVYKIKSKIEKLK